MQPVLAGIFREVEGAAYQKLAQITLDQVALEVERPRFGLPTGWQLNARCRAVTQHALSRESTGEMLNVKSIEKTVANRWLNIRTMK